MTRDVSVTMAPAAPVAGGKASAVWLVAVLLLSGCGLMFELMLTRIFSATIWYHYAFVAISVALLGWGLGGFLVYMLGLARRPHQARGILIVLSLLLSITLQAFLYTILQLPFTPERLTLYFLLSILPFLAGGAALSLAFEANGHDINRLYFADLVGAAAGVLLVPVVIGLLGAETAILAIAVLPAAAAVLLSAGTGGVSSRRLWQALAVVVLIGNLAVTGWNYRTQSWTIRDAPGKALYKLRAAHKDTFHVVSDHWNAYSRITAVQGFDDFHVARLFIDSDAETSVLRWDGSMNGVKNATGRQWFRAFPLRLSSAPKVLVIGPGGGTDVVMSILAGSPQVTGVEMNPLMVEAVRQFGAEAGDLYSIEHPKMRLIMDEGRNFVQRTPERFDTIILGFVDSWASVASGGLALTENYLYTQDALQAYYDHLSDRGTLAIVRWPSDIPRLVSNAVSFLSARHMPIEEIGRHILAVSERTPANQDDPVETIFMLTSAPLTAEMTDKLLAGFDNAHVVWSSWRPSESVYADLFEGRIDFATYTNSFATMATPVDDGHPFYFATWKPLGIPPFAARLVSIPLAAVIGFAVLLLLAGRLLHVRAPGGRTILYFGALGVGFIIVEVALIQRLILLLGHPIYTLVVILFTLLLASGLGSRYAGRFTVERIHRALGYIIPLVILLVLVGAVGLPLVVKAAIPLSQVQRIAVAAILTFPFGFLMGMPFPLGLRRHAQDPAGAPVSSLWGINGVASVIGSVAGMMVAVAAGFTWVFICGALCYAVAWTVRPK
jgi:spermidine synthase